MITVFAVNAVQGNGEMKMTKFEEKKKEAYGKASMKGYGNTAGSVQMLYLLNELENAGLLKEHQALPVVPECIVEWIEILKTKGLKPLKNPETYGETGFTEEKLQNIVFWISENQEDYMRAWLDGYTVEKPQQKSTAWKPGAMSLFLWRTENEKIFQEKAWKRSIEKKLEDIKNR